MGEAAGSAPLVDAHVHAFKADMPLVPDAWTRIDYDFPGETLLAMLDAHGVRFAVVSGLSISGTWNDYVLGLLRQQKRLRGTAIVDPNASLAALRAMRDDGIVGVRFQLARRKALPDFRADEWTELFRHVRDFGWHVHLAIEGPRLPPVLDALLESGADLVIDHFGHPDPADPLGCAGYRAMIDAVQTGRLWVKMAAGFRLPGTEAWKDKPAADLDAIADRVAADLLSRVGTDRLLWGSDAPFVGYERRMTYERVLDRFCSWVPDARRRGEIDQTALNLYFR